MRAHLLLILFLVSTVSARAQIKWDIDETAIDLPAGSSINGANHEFTKRNVVEDVDMPTRAFRQLMDSILSFVRSIVRMCLNMTGTIVGPMLRISMEPVTQILPRISKLINWIFSFF